MSKAEAQSSEDMLLQDSEVRLESMELLLKSVRRDINALSEKLPSPMTIRSKLASPPPDDGFVHESGTKHYLLSVDQQDPLKSPFSPIISPQILNQDNVEVVHVEHHKCFYNLGLGSHTSYEVFDVEDDVEINSKMQELRISSEKDLVSAATEEDKVTLKSWRSPADFRQSSSLVTTFDSPPTSPTFGKSDELISLKNILIHSENVDELVEQKGITAPFGSTHSLATIEENSEEDRAMTDSENADVSVSNDVPNLPMHTDLKTADFGLKNRSSKQVAISTRSCESMQTCANAFEPRVSQISLDENMPLRRTNINRSLTERSFERPHSGGSFLSNIEEFRLHKNSEGQSLASLKSRESMISEAESYLTAHSQPYPSSSGEDAYVTAYSDNDGYAESVSSDEEGMNTVRANKDLIRTPTSENKVDFYENTLRKGSDNNKTRKMVLQPIKATGILHHSDDVLEFTLVEANCSTPVPPSENNSYLQANLETAKPNENSTTTLDLENSSVGHRRKPLKKRQPKTFEDSDSDDSSDMLSSSADEAEYDATKPYIFTNMGFTEDTQNKDETGVHQLPWNRLSCIEEKSWAGEGSDEGSMENSDVEEDVVRHFDNEQEENSKTIAIVALTNQENPVRPIANQIAVAQEPIHESLTNCTYVSVVNVGIQENNEDSERAHFTFIQTGEVNLENQINPIEEPSYDIQTECITASSSSTEYGETEEDMAVRMPGYPQDIPEGKRKYLQNRHHVSVTDEPHTNTTEYQPMYATKRGPITAVATSQVIMQSHSPGGIPGTAIFQAEATASHHSIAASRATAKAAGLASQSAAAAMARNPVSCFNDDEEYGDDVDVYISTSCHVGRFNPPPNTNSLPSFTPRIDLPRRTVTPRKRSDNEELRRARRDHFLSTAVPAVNNMEETFFMGDAGDTECEAPAVGSMTEPCKRRYWRLRSLPSDGDSKPQQPQQSGPNYRSRSVSRLHKQMNSSNRMYTRSGSRYRSTDIDVALASSREHLMGTSLTEEDRKNVSLFDLTTRQGYNGSSANLIKSPSNPNYMQLLNGKSTNSLLETDIDTGEHSGQPIILETDVDTLDTYQVVANQNKDKSYSLFNLTNLSTPWCHRQCIGEDLGERSRKGAYERAQSMQGIHNDGAMKTDSKSSTNGTLGLIARLKARATSTHELRVAESLTRLHVPDWLDKADLSKPILISNHNSRRSSISPCPDKFSIPRYGRSESRSNDFNPLCKLSVDTISKPLWTPAPKIIHEEDRKPLRPSQAIRERDAASIAKLMPISSNLRNSMRSLGTSGIASPIDRRPVLNSQPISNAALTHLTPDDFLTHGQKVWGDKPPHSKSRLQPIYHQNGGVTTSAELLHAPMSLQLSTNISTKLVQRDKNPSNELMTRENGETHIKTLNYERKFPPITPDDSIKMADDDANSDALDSEFYNPQGIGIQMPYDDTCIYEEVNHLKSKRSPPPIYSNKKQNDKNIDTNIYKKTKSTPLRKGHISPNLTSPPLTPPWREIDDEGETESQATAGLDKISTLTCLTDLMDRCSTRHLTLLQNRPSALENLLAQLGWWPSTPSSTNQRTNQSSAELIALAAGRFDINEDGHRHEFLALLASPAGRGPVSLTEFGFDQLRIGIDRNPKDGMLYLHCTSPSCPRVGPTRVDRARSWVTCTNCFTAYCSPKCREEAASLHGSTCTFGRARLICGRILHQISIGQLSSLTVLAKAGMARLGNGGILLSFASVKHAEYFYMRCSALPNHPGAENTIPHDNMADADRPSPSGLMAAPLYLTAKELSDLDSRFSLPCRTYTPSNSLVLIVIVCAYDLETIGNGRSVHLFKQSIILPFPTGTNVFPSMDAQRISNEVAWTQSKTTKEEREVFFKKLQRTLRERGVSLRNHYKDEYRQLTQFVETGEVFRPIEFEFHDYIAEQIVKCTLAPMREAVLQPQPRKSQLSQLTSRKIIQSSDFRKTTNTINSDRRTAETEL